MARPLRIEFPGAIYHLMSRGNGRQQIFQDDEDYTRLRDRLSHTVMRYEWQLLGFVMMPNHFHLFLRTPQPNLSRGMQYLLSGYANWYAKRHRRPGHLFQGRFKGELVEDESYFWTVSRYVHLNPVRGKRPLVQHPSDWPWSSYPGYAQRRKRVDWIAYGILYSAWRGEMGGSSAKAAYRRFVEQGLAEPPANPFRSAVAGWLLGSQQFVERMRGQMKQPKYQDEVPRARQLANLDVDTVLETVAEHYGVSTDIFRSKRSGGPRRDFAAWLARSLTTATLRELAEPFGLTHPDSVRNLIRRVDRAVNSRTFQRDLKEIRQKLIRKTENRV